MYEFVFSLYKIDYVLDYETRQVYNITVTCLDSIHLFSIAKNLSIDVTDVNEAPVELELIPKTVDINFSLFLLKNKSSFYSFRKILLQVISSVNFIPPIRIYLH